LVKKPHKKFIQFLYIAIGFLAELETFIGISKNLGYVKILKVPNIWMRR